MEEKEQPNFNLGSSWDFSNCGELDDEQPNFDLGFSWDFTDCDEQEDEQQPNFDLGFSWDFSDEDQNLISDNEGDQPMFDLHFDSSSDDDNMDLIEQDGEGQDDARYVIEQVRQRNIAKFNVQGRDYLLKVHALNRELSYDEAVLVLHNIIQGNVPFLLTVLHIHVFMNQFHSFQYYNTEQISYKCSLYNCRCSSQSLGRHRTS